MLTYADVWEELEQLCTKARFAKFAGTATERDFVEAPSQVVCVCVCACVRACVRACVCVCACVVFSAFSRISYDSVGIC
jgi:hypothetical protein